MLFGIKKIILILFWFCFLVGMNLVGKEDLATKLEKVKIGFYVNDISKLNIKDNSFQVDFYVWFLWEDNELKPYETFELMNGRIELQNLIETKKIKNQNYVSKRIKATIRQNFDATRFPLDQHKLLIAFEDTVLEKNSLVYIPDNGNTRYDPDIVIPGYKVGQNQIVVGIKTYESNWGDNSLRGDNKSVYSRATYEIEIARDGYEIFFKIFLGFFISICIALASFFIRPDYGARFSLSIGAIFAAATNTMMVKTFLPESNNWMLADIIGIYTLFIIFLTIVFSIYSLKLYDDKQITKLVVIDRRSFVVLLLLYIGVVAFFSVYH